MIIIFRKTLVLTLLFAIVIIAAGFGSCTKVRDFVDFTDRISEDIPTADDTLTSLLEINRMMENAMARGEEELTFNAADFDDDTLKNIGGNLSSFWGKPVRYSVSNEFKGIKGVVPDGTADVKKITYFFELSNNFFVYDYIRNGNPIPEDKTRAKEIAGALPAIAGEIFSDPTATSYGKALAAHNWLVSNLDYDETTPEYSDLNGTYGALILRRTMCLGYSEGLELLLKCYTDVETVQMVGEALNSRNEYTELGATGGAWGGHAWNAVNIDGAWYQIDPTFNDPRGGPANQISHFYFGQTDEVMSKNHRWASEYFPVSNTENFLYFRQSGLFMEDWASFEALLSEIMQEDPIEYLEIAVRGTPIDEDNIQFLYQISRDLKEIWWNEQVWEDIRVNSIELIYSTD